MVALQDEKNNNTYCGLVGFGLFAVFFLTIFLPVDFAIYRSVSSISLMAASFYFAGWILTNQFLIKKRNLILFITLGLISIFSLSILRVKLLDYFAGDAAFFSGPVRSNRFFDPDNITLRKNILRYSRLGAGRIPYLTGFLIASDSLHVPTVPNLVFSQNGKIP